jgi:hypothetical protein
MTTPGATTGPAPPPPTVTPASTHVAKKPRLEAAAAATDTTKDKLHPTGETPGFLGDSQGGITLYFIDECEDEPAATFFAHMDKRGNLWSMQAQKLGLECPKFLRKFLRKCIAAGNPMIIFREEDDGLQNNVHLEIWEAMKEKAEETDEELDDDMFATELHDLVDSAGLKFKHEHKCDKTCAQPYDVKIQVYRRN